MKKGARGGSSRGFGGSHGGVTVTRGRGRGRGKTSSSATPSAQMSYSFHVVSAIACSLYFSSFLFL